MHWIFKQKDAWLDKPFVRLEVIKVDPATFDSEYDYALPLYVGYVVKTALEDRWYVGSELPDDAQAFGDLWEYAGGIDSSGHCYFAANTGDDIDSYRRASDFLGRLGLREYRENLDAFIAFHPEYSEYVADQSGPEIELLKPYRRFDDRFRELEKAGSGLTVILRDWLKAQPWIMAEAGAPDLFREPDLVIPPHPLAERRKEAFHQLHKVDLEAAHRRFIEGILGRRSSPS